MRLRHPIESMSLPQFITFPAETIVDLALRKRIDPYPGETLVIVRGVYPRPHPYRVRHFIGYEINSTYIELARKRLETIASP